MEQNRFFYTPNFLITVPIIFLYSIVIFIVYPSSIEIIKDLGMSLASYSIWALDICSYLYGYNYIFFIFLIIFYEFFILNPKYRIVILHFLIWFLVYLLFSISAPLLSYSSPSSSLISSKNYK